MAGTMVKFPTNGTTASAYLATPTAGKGPGVLVIQEWWGLVQHIKNVCDRLASEGFTALAPDMYHGQTASEPDEAGKLFMALNIVQAERDLRGAATYLEGHSSTAKLGVVGFCMGSSLRCSPLPSTRPSAPASTSTASTRTSSRTTRSSQGQSWVSSRKRTAS